MAKIIKKKATEPTPSEDSTALDIMDDISEDSSKKKQEAVSTIASVASKLNKKYGDKTVLSLRDVPDLVRLPSGVHAVDYVTGGGFPVTHASCLSGGYSGGKTSLALCTARASQNICWECFHPLKYCQCSGSPTLKNVVWANVEGTLDPVWATTIGVDIDRLFPVQADNAEMYVDIVGEVAKADDAGLIVFDSVGALATKADLENAAEASNMGVSSRLISKLVRTVKQTLSNENKRGHKVAMLYITQKRLDLKKTFGDPETVPGGEAFKHEQSLMLRCAKRSWDASEKNYKGKNDNDRDSASKHVVSILKSKVYTLGSSAGFVRSVDYQHSELGDLSGHVVDYKFMISEAKACGLLGDDPKKIEFMGTKYNSQVELARQLVSDYQDKLMLSMLVVAYRKEERRRSA